MANSVWQRLNLAQRAGTVIAAYPLNPSKQRAALVCKSINTVMLLNLDERAAPSPTVTLIQVPPGRSPVGLCSTCPHGPTCHEAHSCCWHICTDSGFVLGSQNLSFNRSSPNWHHVWRCLCPFPQVTKHCEEKSASSGGAGDALPAQHLPWLENKPGDLLQPLV